MFYHAIEQRIMKRGGGTTGPRQSTRIEASYGERILSEAERARRQRKAIANLEQDNYHEDPHANWHVHKKRPKFEDHEVATSSLGAAPVIDKKERDKKTLERKKRRLMGDEHGKQRFRKNFTMLREEFIKDNAATASVQGAYEKAAAPPSRLPPKKLCGVCGHFSKYNCVNCGGRYCSIRCRDNHKETRCLKWAG